MACYEDESLKSRIERGPIDLGEALDIAVQVARGLGTAHERCIVHRDVKPANILITKDGLVKIVDFGLAKLAGQARLTRAGSTLGTAAYMSPEQARGEEVDHRTDIWSLGVMLYEMLAGRLPFRGDHEAALLYAIAHESPQELSSLRPGIPGPVLSVINKLLQKNPELRYQTAKELIRELEKLTVPSATASRPEKSIVVLPFENLSPDPDQEYFSDGLTEEVISDLSNVDALRVISRSSAMTFKGTKKKVPEIARELDVQYVLEGSVRKAGNSLRITAQLIDAANDAHVWAEKYAGTLDDVFDVQEKVSRSIVAALKLKLSPEESRKIAERPIDNVAAYQCYLRANAEIWRFEKNALDRARVHLQTGLDILGPNALLYSATASIYFQYVNIGAAQEEYIAKAQDYAEKALALDPNSPQAHFVMGMIGGSFWGDSREWIRKLKTALAINPNYIDALRFLAGPYIISFGKLSAAEPFMRKLREIDPVDPFNHMLEGLYLIFDGRYEAALDPVRRYYETDHDNPVAQFFYATALAHEKRLDEAFAVIERGARAAPDNACTKFGLMLRYALLNERERAFGEITPDFEKTCKRDHQWSYFVALPLALLDARHEALDWLENGVNKGFINYPELSRNPYLDNLRGEERFKKLLERVKREWEHFDV
jgi:TolB-like protein